MALGLREGLNEGIITCRAVLDMMDEIPELTFIRGEATIYRHIERTDPETFRGLRNMCEAAAGRLWAGRRFSRIRICR